MARITYVKKAQPRFETVPVLDAEGKPVRIPLMDRRTGQPKKTKHGREVTIAKTVRDTTRPLPPLRCDAGSKCVHPSPVIEVGTPYKHISPRSGPYGGRQLNRHGDCPTWNVWEYSSSLSARIAQIQSEGGDELDSDFADPSDLEAILEDIAGQIEELASEKEEAADSLEEGFGHETYQSEEIRTQAESLNEWAENVRGVDIPELPDPEECSDCGGTGKVDNPDFDPEVEDSDEEEEIDCEACGGTGELEDPTDEQLEEWREEARDAARSALEDCNL